MRAAWAGPSAGHAGLVRSERAAVIMPLQAPSKHAAPPRLVSPRSAAFALAMRRSVIFELRLRDVIL